MLSIGGEKSEGVQIRAVLNCSRGSTSKPLLVLSCISREEQETVRTPSTRSMCRTPCVDMAKRLGLPHLPNPWMVIA